MSTRIYNGFKVRHGNPALLMKQLKAMQLAYTEKAKFILAGVLPAGSLLEQEEETQKKINEIYEERLMAEVIVYFKRDKILGTYFIRDNETEDWFRKQRWFQEYHYQNSSDDHEGISNKEWAQRKRDWDFLYIPANDGFTFYLLNPYDIRPFFISCWRRAQREKAAKK